MFHNVIDSELAFAYENSKALIFASYVEGFGLPLVEAEQYGIPVLCSDIPVFHEIIKDRATYFDPYDVNDISFKINSFLNSSKECIALKPSITTWEESAKEFYSIIARELGSVK